MKILICNERFLFRFGVDRVLMILGKYFKDMGHEVVMIGNKLDSQAVSSCTDDFIVLPEAPEYINSNEFTLSWLRKNWESYFNENNAPDIAIIAGWPFYESIEFLKEKCGHVVFHDYGAVPTDHMSEGNLIIQNKLKKLRNENLSKSDEIIAISRFLENTQSINDAMGTVPTRTILLGVDHMQLGIWKQDDLQIEKSDIEEKAQNFSKQGYKLIFLLGRWEDKNYKNSAESFEILRRLKKKISKKIKMLVLANQGDFDVPNDLADNIVHLGYVDDFTLQNLMKMCDVGISVSLWEGFNLPLGEMQLLEKPVYVYNVGAHSEVVIHPYYLCIDRDEMIEKIHLELEGDCQLDIIEKNLSNKKFKEFFTWERSAKEFIDILTRILFKDYVVLIDVTNASHDTANSGVMRVTRRIAKNVQDRVNSLFLLWDSSINKYVFPYDEEIQLLCSYGGPTAKDITLRSTQGNSRLTLDEVLHKFNNKTLVMIITETIDEKNAIKIRPYLKDKNITISAIFYDAIPVLLPQYCSKEVAENHINYMKGLSECDIVVPIAENNKNDLLEFWMKNSVNKTKVISNLLPGELQGLDRKTIINQPDDNKLRMLVVSTLEPRKNHKRLLNACMMLEQNHPELDWELTLVGNRYAGNDEIPNFVESLCKQNHRIKWLGVVDDQTLFKLYNNCTFTIYPSIIEGFGMPIMESLWNGKACICSNEGVMSELAKEGGCYTVDVSNEEEIYKALYTIATDTTLRERLEFEAISRHIATWEDYTVNLLNIIYTATDKRYTDKRNTDNLLSRQELLYGMDLSDPTYIYNNEIIGLNGLLNNIRPLCSVICGDVPKEFLSIIDKNSKVTFVNNHNTTALNNINYIKGDSNSIMPILLDELKKNCAEPDFILISSEEFKLNKLEWIKEYKPTKNLVFIITESFRKECREQMNNFDWASIKNLRWIDIDFIQGTLHQSISNGGFACGYISSQKKHNNLIIEKQGEELFLLINEKNRGIM